MNSNARYCNIEYTPNNQFLLLVLLFFLICRRARMPSCGFSFLFFQPPKLWIKSSSDRVFFLFIFIYLFFLNLFIQFICARLFWRSAKRVHRSYLTEAILFLPEKHLRIFFCGLFFSLSSSLLYAAAQAPQSCVSSRTFASHRSAVFSSLPQIFRGSFFFLGGGGNNQRIAFARCGAGTETTRLDLKNGSDNWMLHRCWLEPGYFSLSFIFIFRFLLFSDGRKWMSKVSGSWNGEERERERRVRGNICLKRRNGTASQLPWVQLGSLRFTGDWWAHLSPLVTYLRTHASRKKEPQGNLRRPVRFEYNWIFIFLTTFN